MILAKMVNCWAESAGRPLAALALGVFAVGIVMGMGVGLARAGVVGVGVCAAVADIGAGLTVVTGGGDSGGVFWDGNAVTTRLGCVAVVGAAG